MVDPFVGQIVLYGFNFNPRGWSFCRGQVISIATNTALFSLLGTTYGGNGQTTFGLPDLQGRAPLGFGPGPGLTTYSWGESSGSETVALAQSQMPIHTHALKASSVAGNQASPTGNVLARTGTMDPEYFNGAPTITMHAESIGVTGNSQPVSVMQPYLAMNYCIALEGIFPSRN